MYVPHPIVVNEPDRITTVKRTNDDNTLINIRVGNPFHKIALLLKQIKKQKAFTFTLKGSMGIMGVTLTLATFGIFGGNKILCDKGTQSQIGILRELTVTETITPDKPLLDKIKAFLNKTPSPTITPTKRVVLVIGSEATHLILDGRKNYGEFFNQMVIATGTYNSCNMEMKVPLNGIETYK